MAFLNFAAFVLPMLALLQCVPEAECTQVSNQAMANLQQLEDFVRTEVTTTHEEFYVFVKKWSISSYGWLVSAWHSETLFCKAIGNSTSILDERFNEKRAIKRPNVDKAEGLEMGPFLACEVTGYTGLRLLNSTLADETPYFFYGPPGAMKSQFMGKVIFAGSSRASNPASLLKQMRKCGNWDEDEYSLLTHNCNDFTNALSESLNFKPPIRQGERLLKPSLIPDSGRFDLALDRCTGAQCTGDMEFDDEDNLDLQRRCALGRCHGEDEVFSPKTHTCEKATRLTDHASMRGSARSRRSKTVCPGLSLC
jgi:hypothetical protein